MRANSEGLIAGGVECSVKSHDGLRQVLTIVDLPTWIKQLFEELRERVRERRQAGEERPRSHYIISVGSEQPFALLVATLSTYQATSINPKYYSMSESEFSTSDWFYYSSSDIKHISADVASSASRISGALDSTRAI